MYLYPFSKRIITDGPTAICFYIKNYPVIFRKNFSHYGIFKDLVYNEKNHEHSEIDRKRDRGARGK